jgi:ATP-dependent helicase HrpB
VVLASGHGGVVAEESGVRSGEFLLAIDVRAGRRGEVSEALIRMASRVEREWLSPTRTSTEHRFDEASGRVRAFRTEWYDELPLAEHPTGVDPVIAAELLASRYLARELGDDVRRLINRARTARLSIDLADLVRRACATAASLRDIDPGSQLSPDNRRLLDRMAPDAIGLPSGRSARLEYGDDGSVSLSVKLQELFGLANTPRVGPADTPVTIALLAPNGRPVQVTRDLKSFWDHTYPAVRKELRVRYPKHPWPEDPWTARPTARTTRRQERGGVAATSGTRPGRRRRS